MDEDIVILNVHTEQVNTMSDLSCGVCKVPLNFVKDRPERGMKKLFGSVRHNGTETFCCSQPCMDRVI